MLRLIAEECTNLLLKHEAIQEKQKAIYVYGFELIWSLILSSGSIIILGAVFGYLPLAVTFLFYFIPIRIPAGGFHAGSYRDCFLSTNLMAVGCIAVSKWLYRLPDSGYAVWGLLLLAVVYIWLKAPVVSEKHSRKTDQLARNRKYARFLLVLDVVSLLILKRIVNSCVVYTAVVALCAVAILMFFFRRGGE